MRVGIKEAASTLPILACLLCFACNLNSTQSDTSIPQKPGLMKSAQDTLSIDEHFDTFFKKFQTDSIFQKSRIEFPLKYKFSGDNGENDTIKFIQKGDMKYIGLFVVNRKNAIVKKKELRPAKVEIQFQLAETGFEKDFTFEKLNNRWHLTFIVDDSD